MSTCALEADEEFSERGFSAQATAYWKSDNPGPRLFGNEI
jgi:hypothetical protein